MVYRQRLWTFLSTFYAFLSNRCLSLSNSLFFFLHLFFSMPLFYVLFYSYYGDYVCVYVFLSRLFFVANLLSCLKDKLTSAGKFPRFSVRKTKMREFWLTTPPPRPRHCYSRIIRPSTRVAPTPTTGAGYTRSPVLVITGIWGHC